MKLIIAGTRTLNFDIGTIQNLIDASIPMNLEIKQIVSGTCQGIDQSGEHYADFQNIQVKRFKPDWKKHGNAAGPIRNAEMAEYADALLLIWDGESKGSANMKMNMTKLNKPVYEIIIKKVV
jgi:hypothetical protein